ncbi:MAG TPA: hypothetical protein VMW36_06485 [Patescibacteria group bacterium]|nr:hypothetical protein [Patescibacteria group bacterium]
MILGLDISTSITGITLLTNSGERVYTGYCDTRKEKSFFKKGDKIRDELRKIINLCDGDSMERIERVYVEESLQMFHSGKSSAKVLASLTAINKLVSYFTYDELGIEPEFLMAVSARKAIGIKVPRGEKAKKVVLQFLLDNEEGFEVEYTAHGNPKAPFYDMADSIVIARAGLLSWRSE